MKQTSIYLLLFKDLVFYSYMVGACSHFAKLEKSYVIKPRTALSVSHSLTQFSLKSSITMYQVQCYNYAVLVVHTWVLKLFLAAGAYQSLVVGLLTSHCSLTVFVTNYQSRYGHGANVPSIRVCNTLNINLNHYLNIHVCLSSDNLVVL